MLTDCNIECLPRSVQILRDMVVTERSEREGETGPGVFTSGKARHTPQTNTLCLKIILYYYKVYRLELLFSWFFLVIYAARYDWSMGMMQMSIMYFISWSIMCWRARVTITHPSLPVLPREPGHDTI